MARSPRFGARIRPARPRAAEVRQRRWVYVPYDRLTDQVGPLMGADPREVGLVFVESTEKAGRRPYHKKKLALLLANERHFALELAARGFRIFYLGSDRPIGAVLESLCREHRIERLTVMRPAERELRRDLRALGDRLEEVPDATWLTTPEDFAAAFPDGPPYRMDRFYRRVRRRTGILMHAGAPEGGKLSFDVENRKPWRGAPPVPRRPRFPPDEITAEVLALVERTFPRHFGNLAGFDLPTTAKDAARAWRFARTRLLPHFGPYEDAMSAAEPDLFHSRVSALLNLSRLLPARLLAEVEGDHHAGRVPLASAEGFIRQILGWRELVRHVHEATDGFRRLDPAGAPDALSAGRRLPAAYWGVPSGLRCLDTVVAQVIAEGYSHHITRLMVLGNLATLAGYSPRELTDWFWFAYVDAYDWVVEPNVLAMATFATGDLMTTKPYVSGAAYIHRMSDYCGDCRYDPRRATGEDACPVTALYWTFLERNRAALAGNPRMALPLKQLAKKSPRERAALRAHAEATIARLAADSYEE
jgi:deoxyribodipyrimidine photolyase-related protein